HPNWRVESPANLDWYYFKSPSVLRVRGRPAHELPSKFSIALPTASTRTSWHKLDVDLPYEVYWSFEEAPALTVNGIFVSNSQTLSRFSEGLQEQNPFGLQHPSICILDHDAQFPLNLQRTQIAVPS